MNQSSTVDRIRKIGTVCAAVCGLTFVVTANAEVRLTTAVERVSGSAGADAEGISARADSLDEAVTGDELRYTISFENAGTVTVPAGFIVITNPVPGGTDYLPGSAAGVATHIETSTDGSTFVTSSQGTREPAAGAGFRAVRWTLERDLAPGESGSVEFRVRMR